MVTTPNPTIGLLYPGEMGTSLASVLRARGLRVVTTLHGRSPRTAARAREVGIIVLDSLADVVQQSAVVFSLVSPAAAEETAMAYCRLSDIAPPEAIFVDANSISPERAEHLSAEFARSGLALLDASINGLAANLTRSGTLFLSGERADEVAALFGGAICIRVLGSEIGRASAMKMLLSGVSKGISAMFVELALVAQRRGMLEEMLESSAQIYPEITALIQRMLPTYAQHAARRACEMGDLEATASVAGIEPRIIAAVKHVHEELARVSFDRAADDSEYDMASLIQRLDEGGMLAARSVPSRAGAHSSSFSDRE